MSAQPLLALRGVTRSFGGLVAVASLDFDVNDGEICGLIGPNGAGKSTVFNLIAGELVPDAGQLFFAGHDISGLPSHRVGRLGIARMFQDVRLFDSMTVADNVLVGADRHRGLPLLSSIFRTVRYRNDEHAAYRRADKAIALLGLTDVATEPAASLPFGRQRMVGVARALAAEPRLLLLDEPAAGLSASEIEALANAVHEIRQSGVTILLVEHNVEFVLRCCEHVIVVDGGHRIADGTPEEIRRNAVVHEAYLGS